MNPFEAALELFGDNGEHWTQHFGVEVGPDGALRFCPAGALHYICNKPELVWDDGIVMFGEYAILAVKHQDNLRAVSILERHLEGPITWWNDDDCRTFEDVRLAFKHCAAAWEEQA